MAAPYIVYRNYDLSDQTYAENFGNLPAITAVEDMGTGVTMDWSRTGYNFLGWNTASDGSGTMAQPGANPPALNCYATWQPVVSTSDVTITYNNSTIATMSESGTEILDTDGTYMADNITIEYTRPTLILQDKSVSPTTSSQTITANTGYDGLGTVVVSAITPTKAAQVYVPTKNPQYIQSGQWLAGTQTIQGDVDFVASNIKKDVSIWGVVGTYEGSGASLQAKTNITPTTSSQTITPDSGYDGLSSVQINAMPSGSATIPATTITANPSISVSNSGLITATASATQSVTPTVSAGYVSSGTAGTITVSGSNTSQLTTQAATTYTPTTTNQTIASGKYLTGAQTILGDANLIPANIAEGVTIFGVTGTHSGGGGYAICIMRDLYDSSYHSITTDGTYGESVTTKETRANAGDYVYLARASDLSPSIYTTETGTEVQRTYYDEFEISTRGGGTPPGPPGGNTYIVWRITMPASDIYIAA